MAGNPGAPFKNPTPHGVNWQLTPASIYNWRTFLVSLIRNLLLKAGFDAAWLKRSLNDASKRYCAHLPRLIHPKHIGCHLLIWPDLELATSHHSNKFKPTISKKNLSHENHEGNINHHHHHNQWTMQKNNSVKSGAIHWPLTLHPSIKDIHQAPWTHHHQSGTLPPHTNSLKTGLVIKHPDGFCHKYCQLLHCWLMMMMANDSSWMADDGSWEWFKGFLLHSCPRFHRLIDDVGNWWILNSS